MPMKDIIKNIGSGILLIWGSYIINMLGGITVLFFVLFIFSVCFWYRERNIRLRQSVPFSEKVEDSRFEFKKMAEAATKSIFIVGPNLKFLAAENGLKEFLFLKLKGPGFKVRMLLSDPEKKETYEGAYKVLFTEEFSEEFDPIIKEFKIWIEDAKEDHSPQLDLKIKKVDVVTVSLLFIDVEDMGNARVLVVPVPWRVSGKDRPCFLISKKQHPYAFSTYYRKYNKLFEKFAEDI